MADATYRSEAGADAGASVLLTVRLVVALAVALGAWLRIRGADGDLWLDEVWTLDLIARARSAADIFFNTPHANNHYLNSLWLWFLGPDASTLAMRGSAVVTGVLSVCAAAAASARQGKAAMSLSAVLFATSYFFVHYGSEARGYSGMILCILVAKAAMDCLVEERPNAAAWWGFGLAILVGGFFHLTMAAAAGALAGAGLAQLAELGKLRRGLLIAGVAAIACLPSLVVFALSTAAPNFQIGNVEPFSVAAVLRGLGGAARGVMGAPEVMSNGICVIVAGALSIFAIAVLPRSRRFFPIAAIFVVPAIYLIAAVPTQSYPRFYLISAIGFLLLMSEALALLLARGGAWRVVACAMLLAFGAGQAQALANFYTYSRGHYLEAVRFMASNGPAAYIADWRWDTVRVIRRLSSENHIDVREAPEGDLCKTGPDWLIGSTYVGTNVTLPLERLVSTPDGECERRYVLARRFPVWGLSGVNWWIYHREN